MYRLAFSCEYTRTAAHTSLYNVCNIEQFMVFMPLCINWVAEHDKISTSIHPISNHFEHLVIISIHTSSYQALRYRSSIDPSISPVNISTKRNNYLSLRCPSIHTALQHFWIHISTCQYVHLSTQFFIVSASMYPLVNMPIYPQNFS